MILALPEHHDGFTEVAPRCEVCGRIKTKPTAGLPRHMFCIAMRKARNGPDSQEQPIMPGKGRPFPKGVSGNPGGRPKVLGDVQELARQKSPEAITPLANIMHDEKAPPAARVAAANALLDRGYGKPTQTDPSSITDEELAAIAINGASVNVQAH
jgi:hypothetical protein